VAKNEFKQYKVPFTLHIKISSTFLLKLLFRYSPYILTLIGFLVSLNKILNIFAKNAYKYPKEYQVRVGEEISPEVIVPISFINEEQKQSQLILKHFNRGLQDFIEDDVINKQKIADAIQEALSQIPVHEREKIKSSSLIEQIFIHKFVMRQLESRKELQTKILFEELKSELFEVLEISSSGFIVNQTKLDTLIQRGQKISSKGGLNERLVTKFSSEGVNMELFKDAILAYAFENTTLDVLPVNVDVVVRQKVPAGSLLKFLKLDLRQIFFGDKNKIDYGINYKIHHDKLCFYGVIQDNFRDKTLVVQVTSIRHRILKEIWIHGVSNESFDGNGSLILRGEKEARGQGYEIY